MKLTFGCVAQAGLEQASHKREVGGSTPPTATKFLANDRRMYVYATDEAQAEAKLTRAKIDVVTITPREKRFKRRRRTLSRDELGTFAIQLAVPRRISC